jgi:hypothetical protein
VSWVRAPGSPDEVESKPDGIVCVAGVSYPVVPGLSVLD